MVAIRKQACGYDLGAVVHQPLASETAVVNWPSIVTPEGILVLGSYSLTVPFSTLMRTMGKRCDESRRLRGGAVETAY